MSIFYEQQVVPERYRATDAISLICFGLAGAVGSIMPWWSVTASVNGSAIGASPRQNYTVGTWQVPLLLGFLSLASLGALAVLRHAPIAGIASCIISLVTLTMAVTANFASNVAAVNAYVTQNNNVVAASDPSFGLFLTLISSVILTVVCVAAAFRQRSRE